MTIHIEHGGEPDGPVLLLAHGAGAPADSPFMNELAGWLGRHGITTVRFEFPYMRNRREDGKRRPPDRQPALLQSFTQVIASVSGGALAHRPLFIGGKSMGGRMASLLAAQADLAGRFKGAVCFGYPFHPPGKPDRWRIEHFEGFWCPVFVVQGTRDPFGKREDVETRLPPCAEVELFWLEGGNHDFKPLARQGESHSMLMEKAARSASSFIFAVLQA